MKKVNVILVALALFIGTLTSNAGVDPVTTKEITKEFVKLLKAPGFEINSEIKVVVTFVVNKNNEVVVLSLDTEAKQIRNYIKSRLNYQKIDTYLQKGIEYKIPVRIKKEN
tara:strand:+ start:572 stop:904 length:333 start_codon:yes stop_codon:yes gene_type:complete